MTDFRTLSYTSTIESLPLHIIIPEAWKRCPFREEPPCIGHYMDYPAPRGQLSKDIPKNYLHLLFVRKSNSKKNLWSCINEFSELKHIQISNRGDGFQNTRPQQSGSLKYCLGFSRISGTTTMTLSTSAEKSKFLNKYQIFLKEFDENSWKLDVNIRLPGDQGLWKHLLL